MLKNVKELLALRETIKEQIAFIDEELKNLKQSITVDKKSVVPGVLPKVAPAETRSAGISENVVLWSLTAIPQSEDEIAIKLLQGGLKINKSPEELIGEISTTLKTLIRNKSVVSVGQRPKMKYRLS